jgi:hypothetical protein
LCTGDRGAVICNHRGGRVVNGHRAVYVSGSSPGFKAHFERFAATISARKDVVLYGTEPTERVVGGAAARARLVKWDLSLAVHGGIRAGATRSKAVAWIAADVDARSAKSKTSSPYRLTVVYEKTGAEWKIVQIHFS